MFRLIKSNLFKPLKSSNSQTKIIDSILIKTKFKPYSTASVQTPKICIVGSGPAAIYTAQYVLKNLNNVNPPTIDIYEKLPVPFGLVRYGVAPDHQDVKNVINSFTETLKNSNVNFIGNVNIGVELKINELLDAYNCVVLAYGSHGENYLNIPGEKGLKNVISAKDFVSWYNGLPQSENIQIDLSTNKAVIIGAGNVAIDIARLLLSPIKKLEQTDISARALETFKSTNKVEHVSIIARY
jgi:adrenodoxin-NADP+ reductase